MNLVLNEIKVNFLFNIILLLDMSFRNYGFRWSIGLCTPSGPARSWSGCSASGGTCPLWRRWLGCLSSLCSWKSGQEWSEAGNSTNFARLKSWKVAKGVIKNNSNYLLVFFLISDVFWNWNKLVVRWVWEETVCDLVFLLELTCWSVFLPVADQCLCSVNVLVHILNN